MVRGTLEAGESLISWEELADFEFSMAVEDAAHVAIALAEQHRIPVALFERPWNRGFEIEISASAAPIQRCGTWEEIACAAKERRDESRKS